jgi:hypothetical protein
MFVGDLVYDPWSLNMNPTIFPVPIKLLTPETAKGLGTVYTHFEEAQVELRPWLVRGRRGLHPGTGYGHVVEGPFEIFWKGEVMYSRNNAIGRDDVLGWLADPGAARDDVPVPPERPHILVGFVNYHDDGGQAFGPRNRVPTVYLVAPPSEDPRPEDFVALYTDGSLGLSMHAGVWHTAPLPLGHSEVYDNKQGSIHATVDCDFLLEQNLLLKVPLRAPG